MKNVNVAIIGFGVSGRYFHAPFLLAHKGFTIKSVLSSRKDEIESLLPGITVVTDLEDILNDESIDLVINCGPTHLHFEHTKACLLKDKHVVVEKPFVTNSSDGRELIDIAKERELILSVYHNRRFDGDFLTLKELINSKKLGEIKQFESHYDRIRPVARPERWREQAGAGSGIFFDLGSHLIDQTLSLFGSPKEVFADICNQKDGVGATDYFHVIFYYDKLRVILHGSSFTDSSARFKLLGDKGSYIKYGLDPQEDSLRAGALPTDSDFGLEPSESFGKLKSFESGEEIAFETVRGSYRSFYELIHGNLSGESDELPVSAASALRVVELIEKCLVSSSEKRIVISEANPS
ncbi:hypothetical protein A9Q84_15435 [Halobacteriovorax marinus]|uniref:Oxidoreductase n=1 Tax=Halobacteriovorax marinus TaxID=97084 RepID=A0A1Y5F3R3_9BACT|nr:hypothetical protein A9Q84_15435 [Halobacteriovorax marinus]